MAKNTKKSKGRTGEAAGPRQVSRRSLDQLLLNPDNPRFGAKPYTLEKQAALLDAIVEEYGIEDVLSSMAVNGYFDAEPLVGMEDDEGRIRIVEGNRRLAACLILAGDQRARNQEKRTRDYQQIQQEHEQDPISEVPVLVYEENEYPKDLLPYMGVRHIAAAQPWDSYAKAAWVADVLREGELDLDRISKMIGDQHRTVARMLEGYYFVHQLIEAGQFSPRASQRRGRGSNPEYPFSWIYTALGHKPIRNWLGLEELSEGERDKPVPEDNLDEAGELMVFLLGDRTESRNPAISDSREISQLSRAVARPESREMLRRGATVQEVEEQLKPPLERLSAALLDAQDALSLAVTTLSKGQIGSDEAQQLQPTSRSVHSLAADVNKRILQLMLGEEEADDA